MTTNLEPLRGTVAIPRTPADALREVVTGSPPVSEWRALGPWLATRGETPALVEATATWLVSRRTGSEHTRNAYAADLSRWFAWCTARGCHPVTARNQDADLYAAACREAGLSESTASRRLSAPSSWYKYAIRSGVATISPMEGMERPKVPAVSTTRGMSKRELAALLAHAKTYKALGEPGGTYALLRAYIRHLRATGNAGDISAGPAATWMAGHGWHTSAASPRAAVSYALRAMVRQGELQPAGRGLYRECAQPGGEITATEEDAIVAKRTYALLLTLTATASRIGAVLAARASDLGDDSGYKVLDLTVKGGKRQRFVLPAPAIAAIGDYLDGRTEGSLFATSTGKPMDRWAVRQLIQRIAARAGIPQAADLSPHSMRHTTATILLGSGHALHIVQGLLSHARPETTQRYNLARESLDASPAGAMVDLITAEMRILEMENE